MKKPDSSVNRAFSLTLPVTHREWVGLMFLSLRTYHTDEITRSFIHVRSFRYKNSQGRIIDHHPTSGLILL